MLTMAPAALGVAPAPRRRRRHQPDAAQVRRDDAVELLRGGVDRAAAVPAIPALLTRTSSGGRSPPRRRESAPRRRPRRRRRDRPPRECRRRRRRARADEGVEPVAPARRRPRRRRRSRRKAGEMRAEPARRAGDEHVPAREPGCKIHARPSALRLAAACADVSRSVALQSRRDVDASRHLAAAATGISRDLGVRDREPRRPQDVASETTTQEPNSLLRLSSRLAVLTVSPSAVRPAERSPPTRPSTAGPICRPMPMRSRSERVASNSCVEPLERLEHVARGVERVAASRAPGAADTPNSAMMPSPRNLSTSPPWRSIASLITSK